MDKQLATDDFLRLPNPLLDLGQDVCILQGEHRNVSGHIVACEWDDNQKDWIYFVKAAENEFGPYTARELC